MGKAALAQPKQHVVSTPGVCGGKPCIAGTRIRVWDIASLAQAGNSPDEILIHYPRLTLADVHAALAYYYDNRKAIDARMAQDDRFAQTIRRERGSGPQARKITTEAKISGKP